MIDKIKNIIWLIMAFFTVCAFVQGLITLQPRVTKLEERVGACDSRYTQVETRVSGIEIKLDALLRQSEETGKDIKDIYHLIRERHR